jgi:hypothetical protein
MPKFFLPGFSADTQKTGGRHPGTRRWVMGVRDLHPRQKLRESITFRKQIFRGLARI